MRIQMQMLLCALLLACTLPSLITAAAILPLQNGRETFEARAATPNRLEAVRILKAAAAAVTPKFGEGGHKARRSLKGHHHRGLRSNSRGLLDDDEEEGQERERDFLDPSSPLEERAAAPNRLEAVRILKAAAAAVTPKFGEGGHKARGLKRRSRGRETPVMYRKKKRAGTCKASSSSSTATTSSSASSSSRSTSTTSSSRSTSTTSSSRSTSTSMTSSSTRSATSTTSTSGSASTSTATCGSSTYGYTEAMTDLEKIMKWAWASDMQTAAQKNETVYAALSAAARYYPELDAQTTVRFLFADINAESTFNVTAVSGGRLDSGASIGLMQVSPGAGAQELPLWMGHSQVAYNNYSWTNTRGPCGPLIDYDTGETMDLATITTTDLYKPWVNIHIGSWVQSNLARTSSNDPYYWEQLSKDSYAFLAAQSKYTASGSTVDQSAMNKANTTLTTNLKGAGLPRSLLTGAGSWVAGPAVNGNGGYKSDGDDISKPYFQNIIKGLRALYDVDTGYGTIWLNSQLLTAGLIDYRPTSS